MLLSGNGEAETMTRKPARFALAALFAVGLVLFALTGCGGQSAVETADAPPVVQEREATPTALPATATPLPVKPTTPPIAATEIPAQRRESALTGQQAPDFLLALYQGQSTLGAESLMLSDLRGKPVVLNFWARLCQPCWSEMPELQEFYEESRQQVEVVGVDIGQFTGLGSGRDAGKLLQSLGITYPAGTTDDATVVPRYGVRAMPTTVFISAEGEVFRKWSGAIERDQVGRIVTAMLAEE